MTDIQVPSFPESITEGTLIAWHKQPGDAVAIEEIIAEIETDKVVFEVPAPAEGVITELLINVDDTVGSQQLIARMEEGATATVAETQTPDQAEAKVSESAPAAESPVAAEPPVAPAPATTATADKQDPQTSPAVRKILAEKDTDKHAVQGTGKSGRITKLDALLHTNPPPSQTSKDSPALERRVPMSRIRQRIAERLLQSSQSTATLTTFNEINMRPVMEARTRYRDAFEKQYGVRLGFMSFFVKATTQALLRFPDVNAAIDGSDLIYHDYCDIGIAVSSQRGLVVPVLRQAESMSFSGIELTINQLALQARENKLSVDQLTGGTFSITNGGVFGSLMSTPILNPPQSAILGMHAINEKPVVENGEIVIRPMMYVALSYDHRVIDGKTSVSFLRSVKEMLEDPLRLVLDI